MPPWWCLRQTDAVFIGSHDRHYRAPALPRLCRLLAVCGGSDVGVARLCGGGWDQERHPREDTEGTARYGAGSQEDVESGEVVCVVVMLCCVLLCAVPTAAAVPGT